MTRVAIIAAVLAGVGLAIAWTAEVWPFGPKWLQVVDERGEPLFRGIVLLRRAGESDADFCWRADGKGWVSIPRQDMHHDSELLATAPACGVVRGELPSGHRLVLPPGVPATLAVPGDFPLPRPPLHLELRLEPDDDETHWGRVLAEAVARPDYWEQDEMHRDRKLWIDPQSRAVSFVVPRPGRWRVHWSVMHYTYERRGGSVMRSGSGQGPEKPLVVEIPGGDAPVELPVDSAELRNYLAR